MMNNKIIIVEDEYLIALDIQGCVEKLGFDGIIGISEVNVAIEKIKEINPIMVIIDINLNSFKSGIDVGKYLLQNDSIPFIYLSSYSDKKTLDDVNQTRPHGYIVKPFKEEDLKATIAVVLNNFYHNKIDLTRSNKNINDPVPYKLKKIVDFININIERKIELDELVSLTDWKKDHFIRLFKKYLSQTPYQYILNRKIQKAKSLLEETDIGINQIAFELGFETHSNFYVAFKKNLGCTPENYRKKYRNINNLL